MKQVIIVAGIFGLLVAICWPVPTTPTQPPITMEADLQKIAGSRPSGRNARARTYIFNVLLQSGLSVAEQPFSQGVNIVATQLGMSPETIIVGSHYDSVLNTPGADDNASGCVVNLAVARALFSVKLTHTIKYIFFDAEERGLVGSAYYAAHMNEKCAFMVNLDMVGHLPKHTGSPLDSIFQKYLWARAVSFQNEGGPSDQTPFQRQRIPAIWIFTGTHAQYHRPSDTPATLNFNGMRMIRDYVRDLVISFDKQVDTKYIQSLKPYRP